MDEDSSVAVDINAERSGIISAIYKACFPSILMTILITFIKSLEVLAIDGKVIFSIPCAFELPFCRTAAYIGYASVLVCMYRLYLQTINIVIAIVKWLIRHGMSIHDDSEIISSPSFRITCSRTRIIGNAGNESVLFAALRNGVEIRYVYYRIYGERICLEAYFSSYRII